MITTLLLRSISGFNCPKDILKNDQLRIHLCKYNRVASFCSWFDSLILVASLFIRFGKKKKEELIYKKTN
jgi:hypothetical protein